MIYFIWSIYWILMICTGGFNCAEIISTGEVRWQLMNQASSSFLQAYFGTLDTKGSSQRKCLTEWSVHVNRRGSFQLQHTQTRKFVCFNRRRRITLRLDGSSLRCYFYERISDNGFTEIESAGEAGLYLGFNSRGRFQDPSTYLYKRKPFSWTKFERFVSSTDNSHCASKKHRVQKTETTQRPNFYQIMRENLLSKVRATHDGPYTADASNNVY